MGLTSVAVDDMTDLLERSSAVDIIYWASQSFREGLVVTSSFQTQSLPLLYLISRITPNTPIFFLDTGFHFKETYEYASRLKRSLGLNIQYLKPLMPRDEFLLKNGKLYESDSNMCCYLNKVEPLQRALTGKLAWISGIRRDQTPQRAQTPIISMQSNGLYKVCPLVHWTQAHVDAYITRFNLPKHPLFDKGYLSIGCEPCTRVVLPQDDPRSGRWAGAQKTECGLHYNPDGSLDRGKPSS